MNYLHTCNLVKFLPLHQICGILRHTVKDLPVKDEKICQDSLQELRETALDGNYYDVLLELLRVQFDLSTFCKMIDLVSTYTQSGFIRTH